MPERSDSGIAACGLALAVVLSHQSRRIRVSLEPLFFEQVRLANSNRGSASNLWIPDGGVRTGRVKEKSCKAYSGFSRLAPAQSQVDSLPTTDAERDGMGEAVGGLVGGAVGASAGLSLGSAIASLFVPGVGSIFAIGLGAAALLGIGGVAAGARAGEASEHAADIGVPKDDTLVYGQLLKAWPIAGDSQRRGHWSCVNGQGRLSSTRGRRRRGSAQEPGTGSLKILRTVLPCWSSPRPRCRSSSLTYAAGVISVAVMPFLPITFKASGMVVRPPINVRANPAALR